MHHAPRSLNQRHTMRDVNLTRFGEPSQAACRIFSRIFGILHFYAPSDAKPRQSPSPEDAERRYPTRKARHKQQLGASHKVALSISQHK